MNNFDGLSTDQIAKALSFLDYECRDEWLMAGMCIKHELGENGYEIWDQWSSFSSTYKSKENRYQWRKFKSGKGRTIGTLMYHAMNRGFKFDEKVQRVSPAVIKQREERKAKRIAEDEKELKRIERKEKETAIAALDFWNKAREADTHPYLVKKDVMPHGTRLANWEWWDDAKNRQVEKDALIIPFFADEKLVSLQAILKEKVHKNGKWTDKFLMYGAQKKGVYSPIGELTHTILICEGWATGATLYEATQLYTLVAIDAGNLENVARWARQRHPLHRIVICADNDQYGKSNTGIKSADKAACAVDADVVYPIFKDTANKPTDFNDLYHESGDYNAVYERVVKPTLYIAKETETEAFNAFDLPYIDDAEKVLEMSQSPLDIARAALVVAIRKSENVPAFETVESIRKFIAHPLLNPRTHTSIMCRVHWAIQNRKRMCLTAVRPQSWGKHNHIVVQSLDEFKIETPVSLIFAPMGSGKTRKVITPFSKIEDKTFCAIAHRRSLISDLSTKLEIANYENVNLSNVDIQERVAVCLPSTQAYGVKPFVDRASNIAIDEISQNIRFTSSRECKVSGVNEEGVFLGLKEIVNKAETIIAADASIDQTTLDFFQQARPDEQFTIVEQIPTNKDRKCFLYSDRSELLTKVDIELQSGGNVWFSVESAEKAEILKQIFEKKYKTLAITSKNSKTKSIRNFLENIEKESRNYQLVIASPAISSGVSVEHHDGQHFTMIAGMASGYSICFSDFAQMLARVRYVPHYHVCLQRNNKKLEGVNASSILMGLRQAALMEGVTIKENEYSKFKAHIDTTEETYRADFANGFVWFLEYYCFEILGGFVANPDVTLGDKMKELSSEMKEKYRHSIRSAKKISAEEAREIENKLEITDDELYQSTAFKIRNSLGFSLNHEIAEQDIDFFENMPTLDRFARYLGLSFDHDDTENNIALRKFHSAQIKAVSDMFGTYPLESTFFDSAACDAILEHVIKNDNRFMLSSLKLIPSRYGQWKESKSGDLLNYNRPLNSTRSVGQILEKFGLSWKRTQKSRGEFGYVVNQDRFNLMKEYAERRYSKCD